MFADDAPLRQFNVTAGQKLIEVFEVENTDPDEMVAFSVVARGLPRDWAVAGERKLQAGGMGQIELVLAPPHGAASRDYLFQIVLTQSGSKEPLRTFDACLRVNAAKGQPRGPGVVTKKRGQGLNRLKTLLA